MALVVKILPANAGDTRDEIRSLGQEEPLDQEIFLLQVVEEKSNELDNLNEMNKFLEKQWTQEEKKI